MSSQAAASSSALSTGGGTRNSTTEVEPTSSSDQFLVLWIEAWRKFEENSRADLGKSELAERLRDDLKYCDTVETVLSILGQGIGAVDSVQTSNPKWANLRKKYLQPAVKVVLVFTDILREIAGFTSAVPGGKAILVAFGVLLEATQQCDDAYDALSQLFEGLTLSMESLGARTAIPTSMGAASKRVAVLVLVNLLDVLAIAIGLLPPMPWKAMFKIKATITNYWRSLLKEDKMKKAMQRMKELTTFETRVIAAETQALTAKVFEGTSQIHEDIKKMFEGIMELSQSLTELMQGSERSAEVFGDIKAHVHALAEEKAQHILERIERVDEADLRVQPKGASCLPGTREDVLARLTLWSRDPDAPMIYWLNGMAGTGKSSIARSFGRILLEDKRLGGSFFCSRGADAILRDTKRILPSLARALAIEDPEYRSALVRTLGERGLDLRPSVWLLRDQFERLIWKPFEAMTIARRATTATQRPAPAPRQLVLVIDALDETEGEIIAELLESLVSASKRITIPVKFFLTSRPETHIRDQLTQLSHHSVLRLHDIEKDIVSKDISLYVAHRFKDIVKKFQGRVPSGWPTASDVQAVSKLAVNLFIHAFTTTQYILSGTQPEIRLQNVLDVSRAVAYSANPLDDLDRIYTFIAGMTKSLG